MLEGSDLDIDPSPSFEEYTTRWTKIATRGGLCILRQGAYWLFCHIEILLWPFVMQLNSKEASLDKDKAITSVMCDESVQFKWAMIDIDISKSADSQWIQCGLLCEVTHMLLKLFRHINRQWDRHSANK